MPLFKLIDFILDKKPTYAPTDPKARLWFGRALCTRLDLLLPLISIVLNVTDIVLDLLVALEHWRRKDYIWFTLTVLIVVISSVVVQIYSAYKLWERVVMNKWLEKIGIKTNAISYIMHVFQLGQALRFWRIFRTVRRIRALDDTHDDEQTKMQKQRLLIDQQLSVRLLGVLTAFMEDAPQTVLQLYILVISMRWEWTQGNILMTVNILKSLAMFSLSLVGYAKYTHLADADVRPLPVCAEIGLFSWIFFCLVSRVVSLVVFASVFKGLLFAMTMVHFVLSIIILYPQECDYFQNSRVKSFLFKLAIAYIHQFSFFPLAACRTRRYSIPYHFIILIENAAMVIFWGLYTYYSTDSIIAVAVVVGVAFMIGISSMVCYYNCPVYCHPSRPQANQIPDFKPYTIYETAV
ncbi:XK-related protein 4 isoform X2 [Nematostella vectensis]|nr:XK-related protein 4 isoform X2 [Nematostella vectensis]XP_032240777.2 XK-related protein 4 isoform X2 [Nematostella vectensis]